MASGFMERHKLWTESEEQKAESIKTQIPEPGANRVRPIRLVWSDTHGHSRAKLISPEVFIQALENGYTTNVATYTLDASGGRVFQSFTDGGAMGLKRMTGSPNILLVPDPSTFRVLPWATGIGWVICDEYFLDDHPFYFSCRQVLQKSNVFMKGGTRSILV